MRAEMGASRGSEGDRTPDVTGDHGQEGADARRDRNTHSAFAGVWDLSVGGRQSSQHADPVDPAGRPGTRLWGLRALGARCCVVIPSTPSSPTGLTRAGEISGVTVLKPRVSSTGKDRNPQYIHPPTPSARSPGRCSGRAGVSRGRGRGGRPAAVLSPAPGLPRTATDRELDHRHYKNWANLRLRSERSLVHDHSGVIARLRGGGPCPWFGSSGSLVRPLADRAGGHGACLYW